MEIVHITAARRAAWNESLAGEPAFALLQSWEWGEFKERLGWRAYRVAAERDGRIVAGAQLLVRRLPLGLASLAYVPRGPTGAWLDPPVARALLGELRRVARRERAVFLRVEPPLAGRPDAERALLAMGFRGSPYTNQPRATIVLDLAPPPDELLAGMHPKTRYNIRYAARKGVVVEEGGPEELPLLHRLMQLTGRRGGFSPRSLRYYQQEWAALAPGRLRLLIATYQGRPLAVNVYAHFGAHAAYLHGASSGEHANLQPNSLLMWEAILRARALGCRSFDLWGIPDEVGLAVAQGAGPPASERTDGLWGVYRFKRGFSRRVLLYAAAHDDVYLPPLYALIASPRLGAATLDRAAGWLDALRRGGRARGARGEASGNS